MSTEIDNKVVSMEFDNKNFESNVKTSMSTIDKLKQSLDFGDTSKGLEAIQAKFSAFQVVAVTALANITNSAINAGKELIKSLSVDNISAGWQKFADKTTSVGTLISQGYDMETVTDQLERLNWFTDETSYNFTDMVANIAKFTASGQDLETSVTALEGIATWAALSGQNAGTASRAMYQLSQAMGAGVMRKEDYKSIQNVSMDTDEFRQKAIDAAIALGKLKKNSDDTYSSLVGKAEHFTKSQFADSLTQGAWFTSEVMMKVFNEYSGAIGDLYDYTQKYGGTASDAIEEIGDSLDSFGVKAFRAAQEARTWTDVIDSVKDAVSTGWMNTFELIFGNYEEAKELWTDLANELYDVFAEGGNRRNELLAAWKEDWGGRDHLVESFWNVFNAIRDVTTTIKDAFRDIFPEKTAFQLAVFTRKLMVFTRGLKLSEPSLEKLRNIFKGLFAVLDIGKQGISALWNGIKRLFNAFKGLGGSVFNAASSFGEWLVKLDESIKEGDIFNKVINNIVDALIWVRDEVKILFNAVKNTFGKFGLINTSGLDKLADKTVTAFSPVTKVFDGVKTVFSKLWEYIKKVTEILKPLVQAVGNVIKNFTKEIANAFVNVDPKNLLSILNSGVLVSIGIGIKKFVKTFSNFTSESLGIKDSIVGILDGVRDSFKAWQTDIKSNALLKIAAAVAILSVSLIALSSINVDDMMLAIGGITILFKELTAAMSSISSIKKVSKRATSGMVSMAAAVLILAIALKTMSTINFEQLVVGLAGISGITAILVVASKTLSKNSRKMVKGSVGLIAFALAIKMLVKPVKQLGSVDIKTLAKGLVSLGVLFAELALTMKLMPNGLKMMTVGLGLIAVAASTKIFASTLADISGMSWEGIGKGLAGIATTLLSVAGAMKLMPNSVKVLAASTGLIAVAAAMVIMAEAMKMMASLSWEDLGKGLAGIAVSLAAVTASFKLMPNSVKILAASTGLIAVASAMVIMAGAMKLMSGLSWEELGKGLAGIAGSLAAVTAAFKIMPNSIKVLAASAAIVGVAAAMVVMAEAMRLMSGLSWEELGKGLAGIAGSLAAVTLALKFMPNSVSVLASAGAMAIMTASLVLMVPVLKALGTMSLGELAIGIAAIAAVFITLGVAGAVLAPVAATIVSLASALALIGVGAAAFGVGILAITVALDSFAVSAKLIATAIVDILITLITAIPNILTSLAASIKEAVPAIIDLLVTIVKAALSALTETIPMALETLLTLINTTLDMLAQNIKPIISSLLQIVINVIDGLAEGIPQVVSSAVTLLKSIIDAIFEALGGFDIGTILSATAALVALSAMMALLTVIAVEATVATALLPAIGKNLNKFMEEVQPFLAEIKKVDPASLQGAKTLAETVLILTAASILDSLTSWFTGGNSIIKFGKDLAEFAPYLKQYAEELGEFPSETVMASANAAKALAEFAQNIPNEGGLISAIAGDNSLSAFAAQLPDLGTNLKKYSDNVTGINPEVVVDSANAAMALSELASNLPNSGGLLSKLVGDNSLVEFSAALPDLGTNLKSYSDNVTGLNSEIVVDSANAAMAISELAHNLPNSGGVISWFAGDNSLVEFSATLPDLGTNLKAYSDNVTGLDSEVVVNSANAAMALSELASNLPNSGGVVSWFAGDNSLSDFAKELSAFGGPLMEYAQSVDGLDTGLVVESATAAKALAELASNLPNSGGVVSWFAGDNSLADFAEELALFGPKLKSYSDSITGLDAGLVTESATAAKALAEMAANLPNTGGVVSWFAGDNLLSDFADELALFGPKLKAYSQSVTGLKSAVVIESANAALAIANLANNLPNSGGIVAVFTGDNTLSTFADELAKFGPSLMSYAQSVDGLKSSVVVNSISAASALAELASNLPSVGGIGAVFSGDSSLSSFARELSEFGPAFKSYATSVDGIEPSVIVDSANAAKALTEMANNLPETGGLVSWFTGDQDLGDFGDTLAEFGEYFKEYYEYIRDINVTVLSAVTKETNELIKMAENMKSVDTDCVSDFGDALEDLGDSGVEGFITAFTNAKQRVQTAGQEMIDSFTSGASGKTDFVNSTFSTIIDSALTKITSSTNAFETNAQGLVTAFVTGIQNKGSAASGSFNTIVSDTVNTVKSSTRYWDFYNAGTYLVEGFSDGISARTWRAKAKSAAMAQAALDAAKETLKIRSPSKEAYKIGGFTGQGFVNALEDYESIAYRAGSGMADYAMEGIGNAIVNVSDLIETGIDSEPTIKPVIDLTDVQNGANQLYRLMNGTDYAVTGSLNMANQAATGVNRSLRNTYNLNDGFGSSAASTGTSVNSSTTFENTFNITGDNPRDIANEVSRIIQQQVERRNASWA